MFSDYVADRSFCRLKILIEIGLIQLFTKLNSALDLQMYDCFYWCGLNYQQEAIGPEASVCLTKHIGQDVDHILLARTRILHLTAFVGDLPLEAQTEAVQMLPKDILVSLDPGDLYADRGIEGIAPLVERADIVLPGEGELLRLTGAGDRHSAADALLDGVLILVAGTLLLTPGVLTDAVGLILLIPPCRKSLKRRAIDWLKSRFRVEMAARFGGADRVSPDDVIDSHVAPGNGDDECNGV